MQHEEGNFIGYKNLNIYYQYWLPEGNNKAILINVHGYAGHSGYQDGGNLEKYFVPKGYPVYALDQRGHGRSDSDGERGKVDEFDDYVKDLKIFFDIVRTKHPKGKIYLIGHSMGTAVILVYAIRYQSELDGLITSTGRMVRAGEQPIPAGLPGQPKDYSRLSRDPAVIEAWKNDSLVLRGPIPQQTRLAVEGTWANLHKFVPQIKLPVLIMAGTGTFDGGCSQVLHELIGSEDKTLKLFDGMKHLMFREPGYPQVLAVMEEWLKTHL